MSNSSDRRISVAVPAAVVATASLGAYLYYSGRMRFVRSFPFVRCSLRKSFASVKQRTPPKLGAPIGGISVDPASYPWVQRDLRIVEDKFGIEIADPYRWLEDPNAPRTAAFIETQNLFTSQVLQKCETREKFQELFTAMYNFPKFGCPLEKNERYYYSFNSGLQNQRTLYVDNVNFNDPKLFLDPNDWSSDGSISLGDYSFSESGTWMAYEISVGGSDWTKIKVLKVLNNPINGQNYQECPDEIEFVKYSGIEWSHDDKGFFYCRYLEPSNANGNFRKDNTITKYHRLCYHVLGTPQSEDPLVLCPEENSEYVLGIEVTEDGKYLIVTPYLGCSPGNEIRYLDLSSIPKDENGVMDFKDTSEKVVALIDNAKYKYKFITNQGTMFTFLTDKDAPRRKLVQVDVRYPNQWKDVLPQHENDVLEWARAVKNDKIVVCYLRDCSNVLELRTSSSGDLIQEIEVPKFGSVSGFSGKASSSEVFIGHQSFIHPITMYRFNAETLTLDIVRKTVVPEYDPNEYVTEQVFVDSYDKTVKVPMFITHKKGIEMKGEHPTLFYGYGGFSASIRPSFSTSKVAFIMAYGGIYASANTRGGNEYGSKWKEAGMFGNKQNVFDDFQACSEYLIQQKYCNPSKLAIQGGSNGGLLVAACANQRPDLYGCVICQVGVLDMLRFHKFTAGRTWIPEYGNPDDVNDFEYLIKYSPLHNIQIPLEGTRQYPSILLTTADHDDRVSPLHTFKFLSELQHTFTVGEGSVQTNPLISRIDFKAGHGGGRSTSQIIEEVTDVTSFIAACLRAEWQLS